MNSTPAILAAVVLATPAVAAQEEKPRTTSGGRSAAPAAAEPVRYARLFVYTSSNVRPRHAAVVRKALERRVESHSSGFRAAGREAVLELGPVSRGAFHWRAERAAGGELVFDKNTSAKAAWPFAAVLEYTGSGEPRARIDWFRRARHSEDVGAWTKDPADQRYADHISDATVCHQDARYCYMAVVDTPTGGVIDANQWAVRGRVHWTGDAKGIEREKNAKNAKNVAERILGWRIWFHTPGADEHWYVSAVPLVGWQPVTVRGRRRAVAELAASAPLPAGELAPFGTRAGFRFPAVPDTEP